MICVNLLRIYVYTCICDNRTLAYWSDCSWLG